MSIYEELKALTQISAVSGQEDLMISEVKKQLSGTGAEIYVDKLGNITATFTGIESPDHSILFLAHTDEIGLMVKSIENNGFLRVERIGGVPEKTLLGTFVDVHTLDNRQSYTGFFGTYSHHLTPADKKYAVPIIKNMYIDLGCQSREEVLALGIDVGSSITYTPTFQRLGQHRVTAKALDNRMAVYILLKMAEHLTKNPPDSTVILCFSVQEEFNIRGCLPVFTRLEPDAAICLDITPAYDTPELYGEGEIYLGKGPALLYLNFHGRGTLAGLIPNPKLNQFIKNTAGQKQIQCQHDVVVGVITDDAFTVVAGKEGIPMSHISVPMRYTHSPVETMDVRDIEQTLELTCAIADGFSKSLDLSRG